MTPDRLEIWDQRARDAGLPENWRLADHEREALRHAVLSHRNPDDDLWVYAYGSLMWDPGIHFSEVRMARLEGYQRCFGYRINGGRGTPERPALMLTLVRQAGCCTGLVFRVPAQLADAESAILWRRDPAATPVNAIDRLLLRHPLADAADG